MPKPHSNRANARTQVCAHAPFGRTYASRAARRDANGPALSGLRHTLAHVCVLPTLTGMTTRRESTTPHIQHVFPIDVDGIPCWHWPVPPLVLYLPWSVRVSQRNNTASSWHRYFTAQLTWAAHLIAVSASAATAATDITATTSIVIVRAHTFAYLLSGLVGSCVCMRCNNMCMCVRCVNICATTPASASSVCLVTTLSLNPRNFTIRSGRRCRRSVVCLRGWFRWTCCVACDVCEHAVTLETSASESVCVCVVCVILGAVLCAFHLFGWIVLFRSRAHSLTGLSSRTGLSMAQTGLERWR